MKKKALIISLSVLAVTVAAAAIFLLSVPCGFCGSRAVWMLRGNELIIAGRGSTDVFSANGVPWSDHIDDITKVTVKKGITSIGENNFTSHHSLEEVYISESVEEIAQLTFSDSTGLKSFTVDENNPNYSSDEAGVLFSKDKSVILCYPAASEDTSYTIPDGVSVVSVSAFSNAANLTEITFPSSLDDIENHAFSFCNGLKKVILPNGTQSIGTQGFYSCASLESIIIPGSIKSVSTAAFSVCASLFEINFVGTKDQWDQLLVEGNNNWSITPTVNFISDYGSCGENAEFMLTRDRELIITGTGNTDDFSNGNAPWSSFASRILSVTVENGITGIGEYAFSELSRAKSVTVPNSVKSVGAFAFDGFTSEQTLSIDNSEAFVKENWSADWNKNCNAIIEYK